MPLLQAAKALPFVVFFGCALAQLWYGWRVRRAVADRHPDEWRTISASYLSGLIIPWRWVLSERHRELADADLTRKVVELRWLLAVNFVAWLGCMATLVKF